MATIKNLVDLATFDASRAINLRDAIRSGILNIRGKRPSLQVTQRWANPNRGCMPIGDAGPRLVLPTVQVGRERLTMPEWVEAFVRERAALMVDRSRRLMGM
jgi:hypothetical protein